LPADAPAAPSAWLVGLPQIGGEERPGSIGAVREIAAVFGLHNLQRAVDEEAAHVWRSLATSA
jgi:hypothetical protein